MKLVKFKNMEPHSFNLIEEWDDSEWFDIWNKHFHWNILQLTETMKVWSYQLYGTWDETL